MEIVLDNYDFAELALDEYMKNVSDYSDELSEIAKLKSEILQMIISYTKGHNKTTNLKPSDIIRSIYGDVYMSERLSYDSVYNSKEKLVKINRGPQGNKEHEALQALIDYQFRYQSFLERGKVENDGDTIALFDIDECGDLNIRLPEKVAMCG